jgi:hypothetical protein
VEGLTAPAGVCLRFIDQPQCPYLLNPSE